MGSSWSRKWELMLPDWLEKKEWSAHEHQGALIVNTAPTQTSWIEPAWPSCFSGDWNLWPGPSAAGLALCNSNFMNWQLQPPDNCGRKMGTIDVSIVGSSSPSSTHPSTPWPFPECSGVGVAWWPGIIWLDSDDAGTGVFPWKRGQWSWWWLWEDLSAAFEHCQCVHEHCKLSGWGNGWVASNAGQTLNWVPVTRIDCTGKFNILKHKEMAPWWPLQQELMGSCLCRVGQLLMQA